MSCPNINVFWDTSLQASRIDPVSPFSSSGTLDPSNCGQNQVCSCEKKKLLRERKVKETRIQIWKRLGQAIKGYEKRRTWWIKGGQTEELLQENTAALNSSLLFTRTTQIPAQHRFQFTLLKEQASWAEDLYLWKRKNNHTYKLEQQQHMGTVLVQVLASRECVIKLNLSTAPLENLVCSSVHPNTVACS